MFRYIWDASPLSDRDLRRQNSQRPQDHTLQQHHPSQHHHQPNMHRNYYHNHETSIVAFPPAPCEGRPSRDAEPDAKAGVVGGLWVK